MKAEFLKRMVILAEICRHKLDEYQIELYDKELSPRGYDKLCKAIDSLIIKRKSNERFPSIADFRELIPLETKSLPQGFDRNSMFTTGQQAFLFEITKRVSRREFKNQNEFVKEFTRILNQIIEEKNLLKAHNLFTEVSESFNIPYSRI